MSDNPMANIPGMSLRDWFAGQAISAQGNLPQHWDEKFRAGWAYRVADAMLAARKAPAA